MSASSVPKIKLSNGVQIPSLGLGTYKAAGDDVRNAVKWALEAGYRHFDSADYYKNLNIIGQVLNEAITAGKVTRSELFITTKVWCTDMATPGGIVASVKRQITESGLGYFDLVLLHWPMVFSPDSGSLLPLDASGKLKHTNRPLAEIYAELEQAQELKLTRSIGLSNFNSEQLKTILATVKILPVIQQIECHAYLAQKKMHTLCSQYGITLTAYAPIGRGTGSHLAFNMLEDPLFKTLAQKYHKTAAQIALRYLLQRNIIVIPKSVHKERIEENFNVFDFVIESEDMTKLLELDCGKRLVWWPDTKENVNYPFNIEF